MKKTKLIFCWLILIVYIFYSCKKEISTKLPKVETASVDNIFNTSARLSGRVSDEGGTNVTERGFYWDTITKPEVSGTKIQVGSGSGDFCDTLNGLKSGTKYYVKAFAKNNNGISYGGETFFTTQISFPTVITSAITDLTETTAKVGGNVSNDGGFKVSERGIFWGTHANPILTGVKLTIGNGKGEFSQTLSGLKRSVVYYVVAYAKNIKGITYGDEVSFTTNPTVPVITTIVASNITTFSAKIGGEVKSNGGSEVTERGIYWGTSSNPETSGTKITFGNGNGSFSGVLENLKPGKIYYFKAYAINTRGTAYGTEQTFTTLGAIPIATTLTPSKVAANSITLKGLINSNNLSTNVSFEYGTTATYGNTQKVSVPISGSYDTISLEITGLTKMTTYHFRVVAENELGTGYGGDSTFMTNMTGIRDSVYDKDDNKYYTIGIGYQNWMIENLRTTSYNNGSPISQVKKDTSWAKLSTAAFCWYNNDSGTYSVPYGALYNWYAVNTNNLCPSNWHVATQEDFSKLVNFANNSGNAGILKEAGFSHWNSPNTGATNLYNFTAIPGGKRFDNGIFDLVKVEGNYWSSSEYSTQTASYLQLLYNYNMAFQSYMYKKYGMSVRCIKD